VATGQAVLVTAIAIPTAAPAQVSHSPTGGDPGSPGSVHVADRNFANREGRFELRAAAIIDRRETQVEENLISHWRPQFHGVSQELSAAQDDYIIGQLRLAGALDLVLGAQKNPEATAEILLTQIMISGRGPHVLAGCLTEVGKQWTFEEATRMLASLRPLPTTKTNKRCVRRSWGSSWVFFSTRQHSPRFPGNLSPELKGGAGRNAAPRIWESGDWWCVCR